VVVIAQLVQGVFGVAGLAMLGRCIQASEFRLQLDIFNSTARNARRASPSALARVSSMADSKGSFFIS
jgi:hypothetical protein